MGAVLVSIPACGVDAMAVVVCPECGGKLGFHMADCTAPDRERDAYLERMRVVRMRIDDLGINVDDLVEFIEFASLKNNLG